MMNEILGVGARFQQVLTRKFGILGGSPSPQLTPEIQPHFDPHAAPEDFILSTELLCAGVVQEPANAGQKSMVALENPAGSNVLGILEWLSAQVGTAAVSSIYGALLWTPPPPGVAGAVLTARDGRRPRIVGDVAKGGALLLGASNNVAPPTPANLFIQATTAAEELVLYSQPVIIAPGMSIFVVNNTVNQALWTSWAWREVPMAPGEVGPF